MNAIHKINQINQKELENNVSDSASWHADYKDTSYIYIGYLPFELTETDIIKIFSQYGIPTHINLVKDRDTGKSRGFCYLKYEDYKSCVLAIDNLNGIQVLNKKIKIDHVYYYLKDGQDENDFLIDYSEAERELKSIEDGVEQKESKLIKDKSEFDDPMAGYISKQQEDEFEDPMAGYIKGKAEKRSHRHKHSSRHKSRERSKDRSSRKSPSRKRRRSNSPTREPSGN